MNLFCSRCQRTYAVDFTRCRCDCGGGLVITSPITFDPKQINQQEHSLWRYRHVLPLPEGSRPVTLGEGMTPLLSGQWKGQPVLFKCEFLNPTGSFKDRGFTVLTTALAAVGATDVVEDSSGNAGSSLAAYAARSGLRATVYVPTHASPVKQAQIAAYGAQIVPVPGPRAKATQAVLKAVDRGATYASHVYHPLIPHGTKTAAFEICEQLVGMNPRSQTQRDDPTPAFDPPDTIILPIGHGSLFLGLVQGFAELQAAGCLKRTPRLYGVQAASCAPLAIAWEQGLGDAVKVVEGETIAGGVRIAAPPWGQEILAATRRSDGGLLAITDEQILSAQRRLAHQGIYVEPTSALAVAALDRLQTQEPQALQGKVVVLLTGSGFKSPTQENKR